MVKLRKFWKKKQGLNEVSEVVLKDGTIRTYSKGMSFPVTVYESAGNQPPPKCPQCSALISFANNLWFCKACAWKEPRCAKCGRALPWVGYTAKECQRCQQV